MSEEFTELMGEAMDECAPMWKFKINTNYKHGLTKETKDLIRKRDKMRKSINKSPSEKKILYERYKKLRDRVMNNIRRDKIQHNGERITKAKREDEVWKIINEVTKPREDKLWTLKEGEEEITDE